MNDPRLAIDSDFELNEYKLLHKSEEFSKEYGDLFDIGDTFAATMHNYNGQYSLSLYFEYRKDDEYFADDNCIKVLIDKNDVEFIRLIEIV